MIFRNSLMRSIVYFVFIYFLRVILYQNLPEEQSVDRSSALFCIQDILIALIFSCIGFIAPRMSRWIISSVFILYYFNILTISYLHDWIRIIDLNYLPDFWIYKSSIAYVFTRENLLSLIVMPVLLLLCLTLSKKYDENRKCTIQAILLIGLLGALLIFITHMSGRDEARGGHPLLRFFTIASDYQPKQSYEDDVMHLQSSYDDVRQSNIDKAVHANNINVILISMESVGEISRERKDTSSMPFFDSLTEEGVYFQNAYAPYPLTMKSIFSVFTGRYPSADHRVIGGINPQINIQTLSQYFKKYDYDTALIHGSYFRYQLKRSFFDNRGFDLLLDADGMKKEHGLISSWGVGDDAVYSEALKWLSQTKRPFFLTLMPLFAHHPYDTPSNWVKPFSENGIMDRYQNGLFHRDQLLREFIESLRLQGLMENTLLILFGDHGEAFMQHDRNIAHTGYLFEENIRVPLLYYAPKYLSPETVETPVSLKHVFDSVIFLHSLPLKDLRLKAVKYFREEADKVVYFHTSVGRQISGLRDSNFKYIYEYSTDASQLFDLHHDPNEQVNIAVDHPDRVTRYKSKVRKHRVVSTEMITAA